MLPIGAAVFLIFWVIASVDTALNLSDVFWMDNKGHPVYVPGLGILTVLLVILLAGVIITNVVTEPVKNWFNRLLNRMPLFKFVYTSVKDLTEAFVGEEKKFNEPVLVAIDDSGLKRIGFITHKSMAEIGMPGDVAVYFPFSYSFAGQLYLVPSNRIEHIDKPAGEMMKFVVSGGVSHL